jgi:hypothetical protein
VTVVGGERLPSSSINSAFASLVFSHLLLFSAACFLPLPSFPPWARVTNASDFDDSEYSEEEFSSESEGSPAPVSPPASSDDSDDSQGLIVEVWTYIRAVERSGLEGSDESEYSSDEEDSSDSSEEGGGGDGGDDDDDGGDDDDDDDGGDGGSRGGNDGGSSKGSNKASG